MFKKIFNRKNKWILPLIGKIICYRIQWLCASVGGYILITHFNLIEVSMGYVPLGLICLVCAMLSLFPYPHWWELTQGSEREKFYGDEFEDGIF